jgi:hypothetical protein
VGKKVAQVIQVADGNTEGKSPSYSQGIALLVPRFRGGAIARAILFGMQLLNKWDD